MRPAIGSVLLLMSMLLPAAADAGVGLAHPDGFWAVPAPPLQRDHAAVLVPENDLLVAVVPTAHATEVWALPLADADAWILLDQGGPAFGAGLVAVHDPAGRRILVHGGRTGNGATWSLVLEPGVAWREIVPAAEGPGARWDHSAVLDPERGRVLLFGGRSAETLLADTWELRLFGHGPPRWSRVPTLGLGPGARAGHAAVFDGGRERMLLFGAGDMDEGSDAWELVLHGRGAGRWKRLALADGPGAARTQHTWLRDPATGDLVLHGGLDGDGRPRGDVWALSLAPGTPAWRAISPLGAVSPGRAEHVAVLDARRGRMIVAGGTAGPTGRNETWVLGLAPDVRWDRHAPAREAPPAVPLGGLRGAFDSTHRRLVVVAGGQTWFLEFAPNPRWSRVFDAPVRNTDVAYDAARDRLLLHGGFLVTPSGGRSNGTWELSLGDGIGAGYRPLSTAGAPLPRMDHVVALDRRRDRVLIFGGSAVLGSCAITVDAHALSLGAPLPTWSGIPASPFPEGGWFAVGAVDETNDRFVVHGGLFGCRFPNHPSGMPFDGTWAVDLADPRAWRRLATPNEGPSGGADAVYDPVGRRLLVAKGGTVVWALPLDPGTETWRPLAPRGLAPIITTPSAFDHDPGRDRFVLLTQEGRVAYLLPGRPGDAPPIANSRAAVEPRPSSFEPLPALRVLDHPVRGGVLSLSTELDAAGPAARLELVDVRGRVLAREAVPAGTRLHSLAVADRPAGIYFVRLVQGTRASVRKVVLVR